MAALGDANPGDDDRNSLLKAEASKECIFSKNPVRVKINVHLIEVSGVPSNVSLGPIPNKVFREGFKLPGFLIGVKESRMLGKLLLCFANSKDCNMSLMHLKAHHGQQIFRTLSDVPSMLPLQYQRLNPQIMSCFPMPEELVGDHFPDLWGYPESGRVHVSAHVWLMKIDVMQRLVANYKHKLESHFRPFSKSAAILHLQPAVDRKSTIVTVYVADKRSVKYLQEQAEILKGFRYVKVISCSEEPQVEELPLLKGVREGRLNTDMILYGGRSLLQDRFTPRDTRHSNVRTSLCLEVFNQNPWRVSIYMDEVTFNNQPEVLRFNNHNRVFTLVVPFRRRVVAHFLMQQFGMEVKSLMGEFQCRILLGCPKIQEKLDGTGYFMEGEAKFIVLESRNQDNLRKVQRGIKQLCHRIQDRLVMQSEHLDAVETPLVISAGDFFNNSTSCLHLPKLGTPAGTIFNRANITFTLNGRSHQVEVKVMKYSHLRKADVDLLVIYPSPDYVIPSQGISQLAVRSGSSPIVDECNFCYEKSGRISFSYSGLFPVLSSGCLHCRALLCAYTVKPPDLNEKLEGCLSKIFRTSKVIGAQSMAIPNILYKYAMSSKDWLKVVLRHMTASIQEGSVLNKIVVSPVADSKYESEDLNAALSDFAADAKMSGIDMAFEVLDKPPEARRRRCLFPISSVIYAMSQQDLEAAEARLREYLRVNIKARDVECLGIDCAWAAKLWKERSMTVRTMCRLQYRANNPTSLVVIGGQNHLDKTCERLEEMLQELTSSPGVSLQDSKASAAHDDAPMAGVEGPLAEQVSSSSAAAAAAGGTDNFHDEASSTDIPGESSDSAIHAADNDDEPSIALIEDVMAQGHANVRRARGFLCGEYGTGKSSLLRALLGDEFVMQADSTPGVHVERTMVFVPPDNTRLPQQVFRRFESISRLYTEVTAELVHQQSHEVPEDNPGVTKPSMPSPGASSWQILNQASEKVPQKVPTESVQLPGDFELSTSDHDDTLDEDEDEDNQTQHSSDGVNDMLGTSLPWFEDTESVFGMDKLTQDQKKHFLQKVTMELQRIRNLPPDTVMDRTYFELWDFGGQLAMTTQHSICVDTERSFFFLIFNASKDLDEKVAKEEFCHQGEKMELPPLFEGMTHRDFLMMWLSIISLRQQSTPSEESVKTKVFFIATHIDLIEDDQVELRKERVKNDVKTLLRLVNSSILELNGPYFVDNRRLQDSVTPYSEMETLQKDVHKAVLDIPQEQTPLAQMKLEDALSLWQSSSTDTQANQKESEVDGDTAPSVTQVHMSYREFKNLAKYVSSDKMTPMDMRKSLKFFHQLGSVMCHDHDVLKDKSFIFLNPEWILQKIVHLVISPLLDPLKQDELDLDEDLERLREHGVISGRLLGVLWKDLDGRIRQSLMKIMCHFDLASLVASPSESSSGQEGDDCGECYFVPICMAAKPGDQLALANEAIVAPPILLKLLALPFPPPIFHRLISHCIRSLKVQEGDMRRDFSTVILDVDPWSRIKMSWSHLGLQLGFCSSHDEKLKAFKLSSRLLHALEDGLNDLKSRQGYSSLKWKIAFQCQTSKCNPVPAVENIAASLSDNRQHDETPVASVSRVTSSWIELSEESIKQMLDCDESQRNKATLRCLDCKLRSKLPEDFLSAWKTVQHVDSTVESDAHDTPSGPGSRNVTSQSAPPRHAPMDAAGIQGRHNEGAHGSTLQREGEGVLRDETEVQRAMCASNELQLAKEGNGPTHVHNNIYELKDCTFNFGSPTPVPPCPVNTEAPVEALAQTSGMAELSSLIQSNVVAEHMGGACSDPIPERGLSAAQIASISQSDKIQHFSKEIILMLPNGKGGSFYSSRNVKDMMEGAGEMHTHASCLEIAFTEWSRNEQVPDSVELLQKLIEDDDNWQSDMEDARYDFERIIYQS